MTTTQKPELVQSLQRGLQVIRAFGRAESSGLTLSDVADLTGLTRATARRIILTLVEEGYVTADKRYFSLTPRVLDLGYSYIASFNIWELALPHMRDLANELQESCSMAVLDLPHIVYVARIPAKRIMTFTLAIGSRLPVHATSMGHVLLAELPGEELDAFLQDTTLKEYTPKTLTDPDDLRAALARVRKQGWAFIDQQLQTGVRSVAAPIRRRDGSVPAAVNLSAHPPQSADLKKLKEHSLPALLETARKIAEDIDRQGR